MAAHVSPIQTDGTTSSVLLSPSFSDWEGYYSLISSSDFAETIDEIPVFMLSIALLDPSIIESNRLKDAFC